MAAYTIKITVQGTDKLWSVGFFPEGDRDRRLNWDRQKSFTLYTVQFDQEVEGNLDFTLIVGARQTIKYDYTIEVKSGTKWIPVVATESRTIGRGNKDTVEKSVPIPTEIKPLKEIV